MSRSLAPLLTILVVAGLVPAASAATQPADPSTVMRAIDDGTLTIDNPSVARECMVTIYQDPPWISLQDCRITTGGSDLIAE